MPYISIWLQKYNNYSKIPSLFPKTFIQHVWSQYVIREASFGRSVKEDYALNFRTKAPKGGRRRLTAASR